MEYLGPKLTVYEKAFILASQFNVPLIIEPTQVVGEITITPKEVRINPKDKL